MKKCVDYAETCGSNEERRALTPDRVIVARIAESGGRQMCSEGDGNIEIGNPPVFVVRKPAKINA